MFIFGNIFYVISWGDSTITMIDRETNTKLILDNPLPSGGTKPENLVVSPNGEKLYIMLLIYFLKAWRL